MRWPPCISVDGLLLQPHHEPAAAAAEGRASARQLRGTVVQALPPRARPLSPYVPPHRCLSPAPLPPSDSLCLSRSALRPRLPPSSASRKRAFLGISGLDVSIVIFIATCFVIFVVGPPCVRDVPRLLWARVTRKRYELAAAMSPTRRSSTVELESVRLRYDVDDNGQH